MYSWFLTPWTRKRPSQQIMSLWLRVQQSACHSAVWPCTNVLSEPPPSKKKSIQKPPWSPTGAIRNLFLVNISPHSFTVTRCSNCKMAFPTHFLVDLCPVPTPFPHPLGAPIAIYSTHSFSIKSVRSSLNVSSSSSSSYSRQSLGFSNVRTFNHSLKKNSLTVSHSLGSSILTIEWIDTFHRLPHPKDLYLANL